MKKIDKKEKTVYVGMSADLIHIGHLNILKKAAEYGKVIVGVLTDEAVASYKRLPIIPFEQRKEIISTIKYVDKVVPQYTLEYSDNLRKYKPDILIHGDDWKTGVQSETRAKAIEVLKEYGGILIEPSYTQGVSTTVTIEKMSRGKTPEERRKELKNKLKENRLVRVLEAHSGLSGLIANNIRIDIEGKCRQFDAIWISSLTDSASKGKPDIEVVDFTSRVQNIEHILEVTHKPIIVDGDTGGLAEHFVFMVKTLERLGVSAVIIEDKTFPKRNSLLEGAEHNLEDIEKFCEKIRRGKEALLTQEFMIIARIESLIAGLGVDEALKRAEAYIKAGADAIMIHSKKKDPKEVLEFANRYKFDVPLVAVPTTYNSIREEDLIKSGFKMVIYANHLLRASHKAMVNTAKKILMNRRTLEVEEDCSPLNHIFDMINQ